MQSTNVRALILTAVLLAGVLGLVVGGSSTSAASNASWPAYGDPVYDVSGWAAGPIAVVHERGVDFVSSTYRSVDGTVAHLTLATSADAKHVYRPGAEAPFLGGGYTVEALVSGALPPAGANGTAFVARKDNDNLVVYAAYGERRGLVGNGIAAWALVVLDGLLGRPNDYFMLTLTVPVRPDDVRGFARAAQLSDELFPRLASWYGH